jgi:hypothetical protein
MCGPDGIFRKRSSSARESTNSNRTKGKKHKAQSVAEKGSTFDRGHVAYLGPWDANGGVIQKSLPPREFSETPINVMQL